MNNSDIDFEDLRPYRDEEIPAAMQRIAANNLLPQLAGFVYPGSSVEDVRRLLGTITNVYDFQHTVMKAFNEQIISRTIDKFTFSGFEKLDPERSYVFISNHRDIVLDSALFQYALYLEDIPSTEITFGSNLMASQLLIDIGRSNKMFKVVRGGSLMELYKNSLHLSDYIRYTVTQKRNSVWIAQRNGRTKNGIDKTDPGVINMFSLSYRKDLIRSLADIHIIPMTISYQWEPCDLLKAKELYCSKDKPYVKSPGEDLNSIVTGLTQQKGNVHISIGNELTEDILQHLETSNKNDFFKNVASEIDKQINSNYHYMDNNYIASDILHGNNHYGTHYTLESRNRFIDYINQKLSSLGSEKEEIRKLLLLIYAGLL